jgi:hypothetical protein
MHHQMTSVMIHTHTHMWRRELFPDVFSHPHFLPPPFTHAHTHTHTHTTDDDGCSAAGATLGGTGVPVSASAGLCVCVCVYVCTKSREIRALMVEGSACDHPEDHHHSSPLTNSHTHTHTHIHTHREDSLPRLWRGIPCWLRSALV